MKMKKRGAQTKMMHTRLFVMLLIVALMLTVVPVMSSPMVVYANVMGLSSYGSMDEVPKSAQAYLHSTPPSDASISCTLITVGGTPYYVYSNEADQYNSALQGAAANQAAVTNIQNMTQGYSMSADTGKAMGLMSGFVPIITTLLGIIVVLITIGMTILSAFDLCYIAFPMFRNKCEDAKAGGGGGFSRAMTKQGSNGESKLRFVSDEAQQAVESCTGGDNAGKNPFLVYFKSRLISYIVLAILLFILLSGRITVFTDLATKAVSGIVDAIGNASTVH